MAEAARAIPWIDVKVGHLGDEVSSRQSSMEEEGRFVGSSRTCRPPSLTQPLRYCRARTLPISVFRVFLRCGCIFIFDGNQPEKLHDFEATDMAVGKLHESHQRKLLCH